MKNITKFVKNFGTKFLIRYTFYSKMSIVPNIVIFFPTIVLGEKQKYIFPNYRRGVHIRK